MLEIGCWPFLNDAPRVSDSSPTPSAAPATFPPGFRNAFFFSFFNALSFQIILNNPMILYAKQLDASATELGIIAGMMPLLVIFQIPAAQYIARVGYRKFVYAGWGTRVAFIFAIALVPLTAGFLTARARLSLMLMLLFCFNLSRGISSAAWLPWIASLVPESIRGKYVSLDAASISFASFITYLLAGLCLGDTPHAWQFAVLFAYSGLMGAASLTFLKRIPDVPVPVEQRTSPASVPWLTMARFEPFKRLLLQVTTWSVVYGGMQAFTVAFLKTDAGISEGRIMFITSVMFLGGLSSMWFLGSRLDHLGSKPVITFSFVAWLAILVGWITLSGRIAAPTMPIILMLEFLMGLCASLVNMSNTRLAMAVIPVMGRNHFFALYSVVTNLALGLAPVGWGLLIDAVGSRQPAWLGIVWNRFTVFFAATWMLLLLALVLARRLEEPRAASMEVLLREILKSPQRFWLRLWPRA